MTPCARVCIYVCVCVFVCLCARVFPEVEPLSPRAVSASAVLLSPRRQLAAAQLAANNNNNNKTNDNNNNNNNDNNNNTNGPLSPRSRSLANSALPSSPRPQSAAPAPPGAKARARPPTTAINYVNVTSNTELFQQLQAEE